MDVRTLQARDVLNILYNSSNSGYHMSVWLCYSSLFGLFNEVGQRYFILFVFFVFCVRIFIHNIYHVIFSCYTSPLIEVILSFYLLFMLAQFRTLARFASNFLNFASPHRLTSYENVSACLHSNTSTTLTSIYKYLSPAHQRLF